MEFFITFWVVFGVIGVFSSIAWLSSLIIEGNRNGLNDEERKQMRLSLAAIPVSILWPIALVLAVPLGMLWGVIWLSKGVRRHWAST